MKIRSFFYRLWHCPVSLLSAFILITLLGGVPVSTALAQFVGEAQQDTRSLIINNSGDSEPMYAGSSKTQLFVSGKGKVYFD
jgi:hypothetical protein